MYQVGREFSSTLQHKPLGRKMACMCCKVFKSSWSFFVIPKREKRKLAHLEVSHKKFFILDSVFSVLTTALLDSTVHQYDYKQEAFAELYKHCQKVVLACADSQIQLRGWES